MIQKSELRRLCETAGSGKAVPVSDDLWKVLAHAQDVSAHSEGAFDVTVGPVVRLWRRARRQRELPLPRCRRRRPQARRLSTRPPGPRPAHGGIAAAGHAARPGRNRQRLRHGRGLRRAAAVGASPGDGRGGRRHPPGRSPARQARLAHRPDARWTIPAAARKATWSCRAWPYPPRATRCSSSRSAAGGIPTLSTRERAWP